MTLPEAQRRNPDAQLGGFHHRQPAADRFRAQSPRKTAKQVIVQRVREAERERQFKEYKDLASARSSTAWSSASSSAT